MKKQSNLSRLLDYAGTYRILSYLSWVLAAAGALLALVPFWYIWRILREVIEVAPNYENAVHVTQYGWMAVAFAVVAVLTYIAGLMCSHLAAFRIATNLRLAMTKHIATLPLGEIEQFGSGKLRKIIHESTGAAETYLAHQLPDQYNAIATPVGLLVLLLAFDWRLGLLSLAPVVLAFLIMATMTGKRMAEKMRQYGNALEAMSNEAVEYVRGIPVVKTFGQSVFSFKKFKTAIDEYEKWVISYTKGLRLPMMFYTAAVNGVFAFLIAGGLLEKILRVCRENNIALFVDECFLSLSDGGTDLTPFLREFPQLFVLKAFTKSFGMAGLRLGYGLSADGALLRKMSAAVPPWNVSALAQAAGVAALGDAEFLERNRAVIRAERPRLEERLRELGFWVCPSQANYILFRGEAGLADRLRERGAAIRDCANFEGLGPGWYRAAVRLREENDALLDAMRRAREDGRWR